MYKKNILFLDQYPGLSGGQKVLLDIIHAFSKKSYSSIVVLPGKGLFSEKLKLQGIKTRFFPLGYYSITKKNAFDFLSFAFRLPMLIFLTLRLIKKEKIDFVYANGARTFIWATVACSITKIPLFWHIHSIFKKSMILRLIILFGKSAVVKKIFTVSNSAAEPLRKLNAKLEIMFNAVRLSDNLKNIHLLRSEHNLSKNNFLVGNIGILEQWKNQEDLIFAAKYIIDNGKRDIFFFIIGDSLYKCPGKQRYKHRLKKLVSDMGLEKSIIFTGFRNDIERVMHSLDILAICSKDPDPCPLVCLEAAASGLAIISTDFGGTKEIFKEDYEALFYTAGDFKSLAGKITYLSENQKRMNAITDAARLKIIKEHNLDDYLEKLTGMVEKIINGN